MSRSFAYRTETTSTGNSASGVRAAATLAGRRCSANDGPRTVVNSGLASLA